MAHQKPPCQYAGIVESGDEEEDLEDGDLTPIIVAATATQMSAKAKKKKKQRN